jgi:3-(3-hydroxy-phenyl)propionate hydroxylase
MAKSDPVIVIGAGPVGLCLALALAQQDVSVVLIESMSDDNFLDQVPRAGSNHPTTLEFFDRIGLYAKMEPCGLIAPKFQYWNRQDAALIAEFDHALLKDDTRFPYVLQCERIKIIEEALKMAKAHPRIEVRMATEFVSFEQNGGGVAAQVKNAAGEAETIRGSYLVSCEGARSIVRRMLDVEFEGFTYPERTINIEVAYDFRQHGYTERNYISDPDEYSNLFHWKGPPDRWRIHFPTAIEDDENELKRPEALQARLKRFLGIDRDFEICGCNLYTVHQRVAKKFRQGRVLLAGDAAHVNSPIGGMGLNSGVHDAFNLADKLARVLTSKTGEAELDRYERQRRHPGADHSQQASARRARSGGAKAQPRRLAPAGRRPGAGAKILAANGAVRKPARSRANRVRET